MEHKDNPCLLFTKSIEEHRLFFRKFHEMEGIFMNMMFSTYDGAKDSQIFYCPYCGRKL